MATPLLCDCFIPVVLSHGNTKLSLDSFPWQATFPSHFLFRNFLTAEASSANFVLDFFWFYCQTFQQKLSSNDVCELKWGEKCQLVSTHTCVHILLIKKRPRSQFIKLRRMLTVPITSMLQWAHGAHVCLLKLQTTATKQNWFFMVAGLRYPQAMSNLKNCKITNRCQTSKVFLLSPRVLENTGAVTLSDGHCC